MKDRDSILSAFVYGDMPLAIFADWLEEHVSPKEAEDLRDYYLDCDHLDFRHQLITRLFPDFSLPPLLCRGDKVKYDANGNIRKATEAEVARGDYWGIAMSMVISGCSVSVQICNSEKYR